MILPKNSKNTGDIWSDCLDYAACTDIGLRRTNNQDNYAVVPASSQEEWNSRGHLFLVADGMGGNAAGELASKLAADSVPMSYKKKVDLIPSEALRTAIIETNDLIHKRGNSSDDFRGMGTTCCSFLFLPDGALIGHVGDSRCYRLRGNVIEQMTFDHSLVWEMMALARQSGETLTDQIPKNYITRCLGVHPEVTPDIEGPFPLKPGDMYLLCSDGLSGQVKDDEIGKILYTLPPALAVETLRDLAILRGGPDNITVVVAKYLGPQKAQGATDDQVASSVPAIKRPFSKSLVTLSIIFLLFGLCVFPLYKPVGLIVSALSILIAILLSLLALIQRNNGDSLKNKFYGKGPYTKTSALPDESFVKTLLELISDVRPEAKEAIQNKYGQEASSVWNEYRSLEHSAKTALENSKLTDAVKYYALGLHFLMEQIR
ncbi:MAG: serine/threonine-protein phosphatase [Thermoguttaceae bacterium]|nr:serine/threonine-protein phosphatase [Thermoguttaceae bacterium]